MNSWQEQSLVIKSLYCQHIPLWDNEDSYLLLYRYGGLVPFCVGGMSLWRRFAWNVGVALKDNSDVMSISHFSQRSHLIFIPSLQIKTHLSSSIKASHASDAMWHLGECNDGFLCLNLMYFSDTFDLGMCFLEDVKRNWTSQRPVWHCILHLQDTV